MATSRSLQLPQIVPDAEQKMRPGPGMIGVMFFDCITKTGMLTNGFANGFVPFCFSHKHIDDMISVPNGCNFQTFTFLE